MAITRNNHFVPQWYQKEFMENGSNKLYFYQKKIIPLRDGSQKDISKIRSMSSTQIFYSKDLYSTVFGEIINDEIERKLFGAIDERGSQAVRAFLGNDLGNWHTQFQNLFVFIDAQKIRTPKGLDWLKSNYLSLTQNTLMQEMQNIRTLHCTLWAEGVRELVSAENSNIKFITSDHPVTVYNYACEPDSLHCQYPNDPDISLKGSQTIFPLSKNRCLILTNLEYAKDPDNTLPLEQRLNANKMRNSMVNTHAFINSRKLTSGEVEKINYIIKKRSKESIAAGKPEWLGVTNDTHFDWTELRDVLLPPSEKLHIYGGEMFVGYEDGSTYYQDSYGRTSRQFKFLEKNTDESILGLDDYCGCGSGRKYVSCCKDTPVIKRATWMSRSIRERNLAFCRTIKTVLNIDNIDNWYDVRRNITNEQVSEIYEAYATLWPIDTDIYSLLPKPDNKLRGVYTGQIDIRTIGINALGMSRYFDEFFIQNPILNPNNVNAEFNAIESPGKHKYQAIKDIYFMLCLEPFIDTGLVNLIPNPCNFDQKLHFEALELAGKRIKPQTSESDELQCISLMLEDLLNATHMLDYNSKAKMLKTQFPHLTEERIKNLFSLMEDKSKSDPLVMLQELDLGEGGQIFYTSLSPNYEMTLFLAQVTGAVIITDSESRWNEFKLNRNRGDLRSTSSMRKLFNSRYNILLNDDFYDILSLSQTDNFSELKVILREIYSQMKSNKIDAISSNQLRGRLLKICSLCLGENNINTSHPAKIEIIAPDNGISDIAVQRLLLKSNSFQHKGCVDLIVYIS